MHDLLTAGRIDIRVDQIYQLGGDLPVTAPFMGVYNAVKYSLAVSRFLGKLDGELSGDDEVKYRAFPLRDRIRQAIENGG